MPYERGEGARILEGLFFSVLLKNSALEMVSFNTSTRPGSSLPDLLLEQDAFQPIGVISFSRQYTFADFFYVFAQALDKHRNK